jgi:hypothetical protein
MTIIKVPSKHGDVECFVDDADAHRVRTQKWRYLDGKVRYSVTIKGRQRQICMGRFILGVTNPQTWVLYKNGCKLDNRRENLQATRPSRAYKIGLAKRVKGSLWTKEETELVKKIALQKDGTKKLAKMLKRSPDAIRARARKLGIDLNSLHFHWTVEKIAMMKERYPTEGTSGTLHRDLGTSKAAMRAEAHVLGLKRLAGKYSEKFKGYESISGTYWYTLKRNADERRLQFGITIQEAWALFVKQEGRCALTGVLLEPPYTRGIGTASIDRIDSAKGYLPGNIQWVHKDINIMKSDMKELDFIHLCSLVVRKSEAERKKVA